MKISQLIIAAFAIVTGISASAQIIPVETDATALVYKVGDDGRLYQTYFGKRLTDVKEYANLPQGKEAYLTHGMEDYFEPALHINRQATPNSSTLLKYKGHEVIDRDGYKETVITLEDPVYADQVKLHIAAFGPENVYKSWTEITNNEKQPVELEKYASSMLHLTAPKYILTQYSGEWANEANRLSQELHYGKKVVDTKLGSRADLHVSPFFQLSLGEAATENNGDVLVGTLGWTGNFRYVFEVDNLGDLRVISGINP